MSWNFKTWRQHRILTHELVPDNLWQGIVKRLRFLRGLTPDELERLRQIVTLFLHTKQISGAGGLAITEPMRVIIAAQACILILNLTLDYYDDWVEIVVYPGEFIRNYEYTDENGIVHRTREPVSGESWPAGPVILSWEDADGIGAEPGYNVVIHEFAHKLDMLNGNANGYPVLHQGMSRQTWSHVFSKAYTDFCKQVETGEETVIDPYAAENPAEFFAVLSEVFFEMPLPIKQHFPEVYEQLALFYRQDPAQRWSDL